MHSIKVSHLVTESTQIKCIYIIVRVHVQTPNWSCPTRIPQLPSVKCPQHVFATVNVKYSWLNKMIACFWTSAHIKGTAQVGSS